jgi:hypothetical protein
VSQLSRGGLVQSAAVCLALVASSFASAVVARTEAEALSPPNCGVAGGSLTDPAETQRCLAERYEPPKPKAAPASAPSNAAPAVPGVVRAGAVRCAPGRRVRYIQPDVARSRSHRDSRLPRLRRGAAA